MISLKFYKNEFILILQFNILLIITYDLFISIYIYIYIYRVKTKIL